jgi:hypothetical protein
MSVSAEDRDKPVSLLEIVQMMEPPRWLSDPSLAKDKDAELIAQAPGLAGNLRTHGYYTAAHTLDALLRARTSDQITTTAFAGHVAFLEELLEVVLAGFERAVDRLDELDDDEGALVIMDAMRERGIDPLLNREMPA